jgi:hypothetical protein
MPACRLIVCEKTSHWAAALRACLGRQPRIVETRSLAACKAELSQAPASLVALETTAGNVEAIISFISSINQRFPRASLVVLLAADAEAAALLLREAGAIEAVASVLELPRVARLAHRQLRQAPDEPLSPGQFVAERLSWPAHATGTGPAR